MNIIDMTIQEVKLLKEKYKNKGKKILDTYRFKGTDEDIMEILKK